MSDDFEKGGDEDNGEGEKQVTVDTPVSALDLLVRSADNSPEPEEGKLTDDAFLGVLSSLMGAARPAEGAAKIYPEPLPGGPDVRDQLMDIVSLLRLKSRLAMRHEKGLVAQDKFLDGIMEKYDLASLLIEPEDSSGADFQLQRGKLLTEISVAMDVCHENMQMVGGAGAVRNIYGKTRQKLGDSMISEDLKNLIRTARISGISANKNPVHLHDICGGNSRASAMMAALRKEIGETSITCWDGNPEKHLEFEIMMELFLRDPSLWNFVAGNIADMEVRNVPEKDNYWIVRSPGIGADPVIEKLLRMSPSDLPKGAIISTCLCHCYPDDTYPLDGYVPENEWDELITIALRLVMYKGNPEMARMAKKATTAIDCLKAKYINLKSNILSARVMSFDGNIGNAIVLENA